MTWLPSITIYCSWEANTNKYFVHYGEFTALYHRTNDSVWQVSPSRRSPLLLGDFSEMIYVHTHAARDIHLARPHKQFPVPRPDLPYQVEE